MRSERTGKMPNLLKSVFSKDEVRYQGTVCFKDQEAKKKFENALRRVGEEGKAVTVEGVESVTTNIAARDLSYPLRKQEKISKFIVFPSSDPVPFEVEVDGNKKSIILLRRKLQDKVILETGPDSVVPLSLSFSKHDYRTVTVSFTKHYERAQTVKDVSVGLKTAAALLSSIITTGQGTTDDGAILRLTDVVNHFTSLGTLFDRLSSIEESLDIHFSPDALISVSKEDVSDINDLFILVCKEKALRTNMKLTSTDSARFVKNEEPILGSELFIRFTGTIEYDLFGVAIKLFSVCAAINAVAKEIIPGEDTVRILYGDSDTKPMYISMKAFKTEEEALQEVSQIMSHKTDYINAKTAWEYLKGKD